MYSIKNNMQAMNANRQLNLNTNTKAANSEKLSSGYRINRAADDSAGLSISEKMRRQIRGLSQGVDNSKEGVSLCQVADGALAEVHEMLNRITELTIKAANGTMSRMERAAIQDEINQLTVEITRIGKTTTFNEVHILDLPGNPITSNGTGGTGPEAVPETGSVIPVDPDAAQGTVFSHSAEKGCMYEIYQASDGKWHPCAMLDFSLINSSNINNLVGKSFTFNCSYSCDESFTFKFVNDGNGSGHHDEPSGNNVAHICEIDIKDLTNGGQVLDELIGYISDKTISSSPIDIPGISNNDIAVSHSNAMTRTADNKLIIWSGSTGLNDKGTEQDAKDWCITNAPNANKSPYRGRVKLDEISDIVDDPTPTPTPEPNPETEQNTLSIGLDIQFGAEARESLKLEIDQMNSEVLGISDLSVMSLPECNDTLGKTKNAMEIINNQRAKIGVQQNRLEHTIASRDNTVENTTAAESRVRDMDMAKGMVAYSIANILEQAGQSMLAQANQSRQEILGLFQ